MYHPDQHYEPRTSTTTIVHQIGRGACLALILCYVLAIQAIWQRVPSDHHPIPAIRTSPHPLPIENIPSAAVPSYQLSQHKAPDLAPAPVPVLRPIERVHAVSPTPEIVAPASNQPPLLVAGR